MPSKRSLRSQSREESGGEGAAAEKSNNEVEQSEQIESTPSLRQSKQNSRELRRKRRDELKSKTMGVGLSISTKPSSSKNKIVFGDDFEDDKDEKLDNAAIDNNEGDGSEESDDDDTIEEVKSSVARDKAMEQLAMERETSRAIQLQTRTKKRKKAALQQEDEQDFDEDFFAQVDSEMAQQRKQRKLEKNAVPKGRHTAFVATEEEVDSAPIQADHNIELVVLGSEKEGPVSINTLVESGNDKAGIELSEASNLFARGRLANGRDQAKKKGTKKKKQNDPGWKRSKKMNTLSFGRAKTKGRRGCAAANFVVKF